MTLLWLQAERYDDMTVAMKQVAELGGELSNEVCLRARGCN